MADRVDRAVAALLGHADHLAARRWRGLVWLTGEADGCRHAALALWQAGAWQVPLWVAPRLPEAIPGGQGVISSKARTRLGGEQDLVVVDAVSEGAGFDPDAFGALAGTLRAGGLLVLMTPPDWGVRPDADYARLAEHPLRFEQLASRYLARLARQLEAAPEVIRWPAGELPWLPPLLEKPLPPAPPASDPDCRTGDQAEAVARLVHQRRRRPLVITADRGRGKSAALGIACARLIETGEQEVLVTAPRAAAVATLFERLEALCPAGQRRGQVFALGDQRVRFLAPDELVRLVREGEAGGAGTRLLVDEAAAIPAALLDEWLEAFPRIAFATTVHGYEGSGRGFALRFRERLERRTPDWQAWHLEAPIRWAADDPLEERVDRLLLLDAEPGGDPGGGDAMTLRRLRRNVLARDEARLRGFYGLLIQAHYRTTPADLRRLLDGPGVGLSAMQVGERPAGVLVVSDEGGFPADLAERVARGERRPRGHLMAQSLAAHAGCRGALTGRLRRVVRIAVASERRREGVGRRLIEAEAEQARRAGIELLGSSFGAEPGLIAFWRSLGFRPVRLGLTRETATGEHALMMARPLTDRGEMLMAELESRFQRALPGLLAFELSELEPEVAAALLADGGGPALVATDRCDALDVAYAQRDPALARPALQALVRHALATGTRPGDESLVLLVAWAFQGRDSLWLAARLGVAGRRVVTVRLRWAVAALLER